MSSIKNPPTLEQWKHLYDLMAQIKKLAPWESMYEDDIFGIRLPGTDALVFVSVMGNLGEHLAVAVYLGKKGFDGFQAMHHMGNVLTPDIVLQVPQLQASLEDREMITPEDRKILKQLNLKFRGRQAWPQYRSYRPGCVPWYLEKEEAQILIIGLEQLLEVAPRFTENTDLLGTDEPNRKYLLRVYENGHWVDRYEKPVFPADPPLQISVVTEVLNQLKAMPKEDTIVEIDVRMMEQAVMDEELGQPYFPFMLLVAEKRSRMILGFDLLSPLPSMDEMWADVPAAFTEILTNYFLPRQVQTSDPLLNLLLSALAEELGIQVKLVKHLPAIEFAQKEFQRLTSGL
jgi:hypothetical protein